MGREKPNRVDMGTKVEEETIISLNFQVVYYILDFIPISGLLGSTWNLGRKLLLFRLLLWAEHRRSEDQSFSSRWFHLRLLLGEVEKL